MSLANVVVLSPEFASVRMKREGKVSKFGLVRSEKDYGVLRVLPSLGGKVERGGGGGGALGTNLEGTRAATSVVSRPPALRHNDAATGLATKGRIGPSVRSTSPVRGLR